MIYFEKKIFKSDADQKLRCQNFQFWNAQLSLVEAQNFVCSKALRSYSWWLSKMVWQMKIGQKLSDLEPIPVFVNISIKS